MTACPPRRALLDVRLLWGGPLDAWGGRALWLLVLSLFGTV